MRSTVITLVIALIVIVTQPLNAQDKVQQVSIETEPMAYILGGAGITGSYQHGPWSYSIEAFGELTVPESLHGNQGFRAELTGLELQVERFLKGTEGFYIGPEIGISNLKVTHKPSNSRQNHTGYSIGLRGGYHWNTELGNLYITPVAGLSYSLNPKYFQIQAETFESGPVTPWATVGIGWSF